MTGRSRASSSRQLWQAAAQAERTGLSLHRTALALAVLVLLLLRATEGLFTQIVVAVGLLSMGVLLLPLAVRYLQTTDRLATERLLPGAIPLGTLAAVVITLGAGAITAIIVK